MKSFFFLSADKAHKGMFCLCECSSGNMVEVVDNLMGNEAQEKCQFLNHCLVKAYCLCVTLH